MTVGELLIDLEPVVDSVPVVLELPVTEVPIWYEVHAKIEHHNGKTFVVLRRGRML